jgi:hypothetical protein
MAGIEAHALRAGERHRQLENALASVDRARFVQQRMRAKGAPPALMNQAVSATMTALCVYADLIRSFGWPVPVRLRAEIDRHGIALGAATSRVRDLARD